MMPSEAIARLGRLLASEHGPEVHGIAAKHGVTPVQVCGADRRRNVVRARHELWVRMYMHPGATAAGIARLWGTDHTTILSGIQAHDRAAGVSW